MAERLRDKPIVRKQKKEESEEQKHLVLWNDDIHTFEYVIESLIEICRHSNVQAEQCAFITHYKGKCDVKKGDKEVLREMQLGLIKKGLKASID